MSNLTSGLQRIAVTVRDGPSGERGNGISFAKLCEAAMSQGSWGDRAGVQDQAFAGKCKKISSEIPVFTESRLSSPLIIDTEELLQYVVLHFFEGRKIMRQWALQPNLVNKFSKFKSKLILQSSGILA